MNSPLHPTESSEPNASTLRPDFLLFGTSAYIPIKKFSNYPTTNKTYKFQKVQQDQPRDPSAQNPER
ncbi:hypothetical protein HYALB_00006286 [Hymenoscyphus albidus]|uniref:Uncharacterized protein n=1 Tax=Hymenoscyphus albidus TaxID=595503 RepID=A0A9N9QDN4_9HELO|nr:hypothetical protein HYALB_00006286 [Hymenoscyphus albidus]